MPPLPGRHTSGRHADREDRRDTFGLVVGAGLAVAAAAAVLTPVVLLRGDEVTATAQRGRSAAPPPAAAPVVPGATSTPAPRPTSSMPSADRSVLAAPARTTTPKATPAPRPSRPAATRSTARPPAPKPTPVTQVVASWNSGLCLGSAAATRRAGTRVVQQPCGSSLALRLRPASGGASQLVDATSGLCVDVAGAATWDGADVQLSACTGAASQRFTQRQVAGAGGRVMFQASHTSKCLDVFNRSTVAGGEVKQFGCHSDADEMELRNQTFTALR